jgi:hypothetical protein
MNPAYSALLTDWQRHHADHTTAFASGRTSFVPNLLPDIAVQFTAYQTLDILHRRLGSATLQRALSPEQTIDSPVRGQASGKWLRTSNMVGVNVRTVGSFWNVVNYALTLPACHDSIHLLPVWEPGVVGSLYGMVSWQLNPEFFSDELARYVPALNTVEKQLRAVVNLLHALGRTVGMDVIPHTDRFSEMTLTYPRFFEWVRRDGPRLVDQSEGVTAQVETAIWTFLKKNGAADQTPVAIPQSLFFDPAVPVVSDIKRHQMLFGEAHDYGGRLRRRLALIGHLVAQGFETLPMTMAPPYRGLHINPTDFVRDQFGHIWYQYAFDKPEAMSRVFGPLARYKFFHAKDDNRTWELDFDRPNTGVWDYLAAKVADCQRQYGFDFMRGDMAHVQPRPTGVPPRAADGTYSGPTFALYDPLRYVKEAIQKAGKPHFGFFAETFLAPPDVMGYGHEPDHLEAISADSTLGDLQSCVVGSDLFRERFREYATLARERSFAPNFTVMTADKDDPRFDEFYRIGNVFRYFTALFLSDLPSYVGLGFEIRNQHLERGANEEYTKLYVFQIGDDAQPDKVTHGPFRWGQNAGQFTTIGRIRAFAESIWPIIVGHNTQWLVAPNASEPADFVAWIIPAAGLGFAAGWGESLPASVPGQGGGEVIFAEAGCRVWRLNVA